MSFSHRFVSPARSAISDAVGAGPETGVARCPHLPVRRDLCDNRPILSNLAPVGECS